MLSNLSIRILGDCDQGIIDVFRFFPGEIRVLKFQLYDTIDSQKVAPPSDSIFSLILPSSGTTDITIIAPQLVQDVDDKSIFTASLTAEQTNLLITGWIKLLCTNLAGTTIRLAYREAGIQRNVCGVS